METQGMNIPMFPIQKGPQIPWAVIAPHEAQAMENHGQSLKRLAERGGLSPFEAVMVLETKHWRDNDSTAGDHAAWAERLLAIVRDRYYLVQVDELRAAVAKFLAASGHDLCHENRRALARACGLPCPTPVPVDRAEFRRGCLAYETQIYGPEPG